MSEECSKLSAFRRSWDSMKANHKRRRQRWGLDKKDDAKNNASIYNNSTFRQLVETNKMLTQTLCGVLGNGNGITG